VVNRRIARAGFFGACLLLGCGRIAFDPSVDGGTDGAAADAGRDASDPDVDAAEPFGRYRECGESRSCVGGTECWGRWCVERCPCPPGFECTTIGDGPSGFCLPRCSGQCPMDAPCGGTVCLPQCFPARPFDQCPDPSSCLDDHCASG
jgi:hypothetical protein